MAFPQTTVGFQAGSGVQGEIYNSGPVRSQSFITNSASAAYNIIGATAFTKTSTDGVVQAGSGGGRGFAGVLANPKVYASFGTNAGGPLAATLTLANNVQAEFVTMGTMWVALTNTNANVGDNVYYDNTTGALTSSAPGVALPANKTWLGAYVDYLSPSVNGTTLALITINPPTQIAVL